MSLFAALPVEALHSLAAAAHRRRYAPRQSLFRVGDPSDSLWVICSGHVQARARAPVELVDRMAALQRLVFGGRSGLSG